MGNFLSRMRTTPATPPVSITYTTTAGEPKTEQFDFIVVACDPRGLKLGDRTDFEEEINSRLTSHTFHTSLIVANRPNRVQAVPEGGKPNGPPHTNYAVRFDPVTLENLDGGLYAFRDEVMARDAAFQPSPTKTTWAVTYQLEDVPLFGRNKNDVEESFNIRRDKQIIENNWIDWDTSKGKADEEITVDYFAHFEQDGLRDDLPWKILRQQGSNNTLYVASFTCFESVLHCYLYQNMLMNNKHVRNKFPSRKNARIAVIGAGPSGLLFASQHLVAKGYKNFKIFEASERYGGKTRTEFRAIPASSNEEKVACELGTCYLSPAYFPLYSVFEQYNAGEVLALDRNSNAFRSIIDPTVAKNKQEHADGVEYGAWSGYRQNGYPDEKTGRQRIIRAGVLYVLYHVCAMGMDPEDAMPTKKPSITRGVKNVLSIIKWIVTNLDDVSEVVETCSLSALFKGTANRGGLYKSKDTGMKEEAELFQSQVDEFDLDIDISDIMGLFSINLFNKTFAEFLDAGGMGDLKPTLTYAYQVQGYGTLSKIPAYYGLLWISPYAFLNEVLSEILPASEGSDRAKRGTVNVLSKGWGTVWDKIVEKDLPNEHFEYNAIITDVNRNVK